MKKIYLILIFLVGYFLFASQQSVQAALLCDELTGDVGSCCAIYDGVDIGCEECNPQEDEYCDDPCDTEDEVWTCVEWQVCDPNCIPGEPSPDPSASPDSSPNPSASPDPSPDPSDPPPEDPPDPPPCCDPVSADVDVNGSDGPVTVQSGESFTLSWSSSNASYCNLEGENKSTSGSMTAVQTAGGNYNYDLTCYSDCDHDNDRVTVEVPEGCGNGTCDGFENCLSCPEDCGVCPEHFSWWQAWGGDVGAASELGGYVLQSLIPETSTCVEPDCYPYLMAFDRDGRAQSDGFPIIQSGLIAANGLISARDDNTYVIGSDQTRFRETYSYFVRQYDLGLSPEEDSAGSASANGRQEIGQKTGISAANILEWVNHVDLMRVRGVGEEYADLLEAAGVDSVPELAQTTGSFGLAPPFQSRLTGLIGQVAARFYDLIQRSGCFRACNHFEAHQFV